MYTLGMSQLHRTDAKDSKGKDLQVFVYGDGVTIYKGGRVCLHVSKRTWEFLKKDVRQYT